MMTQAIFTSTNVDNMKIPFDDMFCGADVDTVMQISNEAAIVDSCKNDGEKSKKANRNLHVKNTNTRKHKRKSRRGSRNKSGNHRQLPFNPKIQAQVLRRKQKLRRSEVRSALAPAPYNTTQFLMSDHKTELANYSDSEHESDYENEFAKKEFSKEYEKADTNKQKIPINKLIEEYLLIESEVKELEKKYDEMTAQEKLKARIGAVEYDWEKGETAMEPEVAEKIRIFHEEIAKIQAENRSLEDENLRFKSDSSSSDDDSDSDTSSSEDSSSDSDSSDSSDDEDEVVDDNMEVAVPTSTEEALINTVKNDLEHKKDDTGYESGGSSNDVTRVTSTTFRK